mgnify:CR=1 FL=1|jgi:hypothetical protein
MSEHTPGPCHECSLLQRMASDAYTPSLSYWPDKRGNWHLMYWGWGHWECKHGRSPEELLMQLPEPASPIARAEGNE